MIHRTILLAAALIAAVSLARADDAKPDAAQVRRLLADPKALAEALAHCDPKSTTMDDECRAGQEARRRQFFGRGPVPYTPQAVDPFPHTPERQPANRPPQP